jgi:hypothetical protein
LDLLAGILSGHASSRPQFAGEPREQCGYQSLQIEKTNVSGDNWRLIWHDQHRIGEPTFYRPNFQPLFVDCIARLIRAENPTTCCFCSFQPFSVCMVLGS